MLARLLADQGRYDPDEARKAYIFWLDSGPFDCGMSASSGLRGRPNSDSQANGAMMRISSLGIFGANHDTELIAEWARQDAAGSISADWRFGIAYNAALKLCTILLYASG